MYRALTDTLTPALRLVDFSYNNGNGTFAFYDDTLAIDVTLTNYLAATQNATVTLQSTSPYVQLVDSVFNAGTIAPLANTNNAAAPFSVILASNTPTETDITFRLAIADGAYTDYAFFTLTTSPGFVTTTTGSLTLTASSSGNLLYNGEQFTQGSGFQYSGTPVMNRMGLALAFARNEVPNNFTSNFTVELRDESFTAESESGIRFFNNSTASTDLRSAFTTNEGPPLRIEQKVLGFSGGDAADVALLEYRLINTGTDTLPAFPVSLFADWDLIEPQANQAGALTDHALTYVRYTNGTDSLYGGVALLSELPFSHRALNKQSIHGDVADVGTAFNQIEKYDFITGATGDTVAGTNGPGNDVAVFTTAQSLTLPPLGSQKVAFALLVGNSLASLQSKAATARQLYARYLAQPPVASIQQVCPNTPAVLAPGPGQWQFYADAAAQQPIGTGSTLATNALGNDTLFYASSTAVPWGGDVQSVAMRLFEAQAAIATSNDTLYTDAASNRITFTASGTAATQWQWQFSNGFSSALPQVAIPFTTPGQYTATLTTTTVNGCAATAQRRITVLERPAAPALADVLLCSGQRLTLSTPNQDTLLVYATSQRQQLLGQGTQFSIERLTNDTVLYVAQLVQGIESQLKAVQVTVSSPTSAFAYSIDTTDVVSRYALQMTDLSTEATTHQWFVNGIAAAGTRNPALLYEPTAPVTISLITTDANGCADEHSVTLTPSTSPTPTLANQTVCQYQQAVLAPGGGQVFYFYTDAALTERVHKGSSYTTPPLTASTTYFITGIDSLQESPPLTATVTIDPFTASLQTSADTLIVGEASTVQFFNTTAGATSWSWVFNGLLFDGLTDPIRAFEQPGSYAVSLIAHNASGCSDTATTTITVLEVTGLAQTQGQAIIEVYPNPANGLLTIARGSGLGPQEGLTIRIVNSSGQLVHSTGWGGHTGQYNSEVLNRVRLNTAAWPAGVYLVQATHRRGTTIVKVVVAR